MTSAMRLFLDTNIYLGFYKFSDDDLEELEKLAVTVKDGTTTLYLTDQIRHEFNRNREKTIDESLKVLEELRIRTGFPRLFTNLQGFDGFRETLSTLEEQRTELLKEVTKAASEKNLRADGLIAELFGIAQTIHETGTIWEAAKRRVDRGNPPGKSGSYGDAVNWESLIEAVPHGQDFLFVTGDRDYISPLDSTQLSDFLKAEWEERKGSNVSLFKSVNALFREHYPSIRLAAELEKEQAIGRLIGSLSFMDTHSAITNLSQHTDFTPVACHQLGTTSRLFLPLTRDHPLASN